MKIKKLSATLVAIAMLASLASCSGGDTSSAGGDTASGTDTSSQAGGADAVTDGNYGGLVALPDAGDPITYSIFVRDPGTTASDDNPVIQKIEELTGVSFEYEYLVGDLDTKLGTMVAGGDYPDVVFSPEGVPQFIESGAAIALEDKIPQYGNLNAMYNQVMTYLTKEDGHVYTMPIYGYYFNDVTDEAPTFECGYGFYIQKAVLEEAGYPEISTVDEYFDLIEDYMEKHPDIDGVKTSGFEVLVDGWRNWALLNPPQALMGVGNEGNITVDQETLETSFHQISDTAHDYYLKLNEEYRKGVITPETLTQTYDQYIAKITSGAVLGFFDQNWNFSNGENVLKTDGKYERTYVSVPLLAEGFEGGYIDKATGLPTADNGVMITTNCKDVDRLLRYYDWLLQREVQDYLNWGEEGVDWNYSEDGTDKVLTAERRAINLDTARLRDETGYQLFNYAPRWVGIYKDDGMPVEPGASAAEYLAKQSEYDQSFLAGYDVEYPAELHGGAIERLDYYPVWALTIEDGSPAAVSQQKMLDIETRYYPRLILAADEAEFESIWTEFVNEFNAVDLASYQEEIDRQIAAKMGS